MGKGTQQEQCSGNGLRDVSGKLPEAAGLLKRRGELWNTAEEAMGEATWKQERKMPNAEGCHEGRSIKM